MLSRSAQGLYWLSRYLERAEHGCRLLADQLKTIEDRTVEEIDRSWQRLYTGLGHEPIGGILGTNLGEEGFMLADAYTLVDDLTFEPCNPGSIRACVNAARENARQVRNVVGKDMWSCLNVAYLSLRDVGIEDFWNDRPDEFFLHTEDAIRTFSGIAESTMYRDHGWHFLQLGRFVERAQLVAALVDAQLAVFPTAEPHVEPDWGSLLRICKAGVAYRRLHSHVYEPDRVVDFLVCDPQLSHSIRYALERISDALNAFSEHRQLPRGPGAAHRTGRMAARIDYDWPNRNPQDDDATRATLRDIREACGLLHDDVEATYFNYAIEDTSAP